MYYKFSLNFTEIIDEVTVAHILPVYIENSMIIAHLTIASVNTRYTGPLAVEVWSGPVDGSTLLGSTQYVLCDEESRVEISFPAVVTGTYNLSIYVYNNVSTDTVQQPIMVASK